MFLLSCALGSQLGWSEGVRMLRAPRPLVSNQLPSAGFRFCVSPCSHIARL